MHTHNLNCTTVFLFPCGLKQGVSQREVCKLALSKTAAYEVLYILALGWCTYRCLYEVDNSKGMSPDRGWNNK